MASVEKIAEVVLYEGYLLYPYRHSSMKNQQRWTFGGVYPRAYSEANGGDDPWNMQTQCLVIGDHDTRIEATVRYLQVVDRQVAQLLVEDSWVDPILSCDGPGDGAPPAERFVQELQGADQIYRPGEEAIERQLAAGALRLGDLVGHGRGIEIDIPADRAVEPVLDATGAVTGTLIRAWQSLRGTVELAVEPLASSPQEGKRAGSCYRLSVRIVNITPWTWHGRDSGQRPRDSALRQTSVSTHTILRVHGGEFVSLLEPPDEYLEAAAGCVNTSTWPVLVGEHGERHTLLSSPIILYDYPQIAPESPGDLFETTEIDELLTLSIMALTDEEKAEMRESDARARAILERTEALSQEQLMKLHGAIRGLQPARKKDL
ncbi:MAG TPA: hypothetical protein VHB98_08830 [Chloroflexota bacterium]|nr:hypothetical protein [Chloroflexota bacterium]